MKNGKGIFLYPWETFASKIEYPEITKEKINRLNYIKMKDYCISKIQRQ